jgi:hypothetical protein
MRGVLACAAIVLAAPVLTGCGSAGARSSPPATSSAAADPATSDASSGRITVDHVPAPCDLFPQALAEQVLKGRVINARKDSQVCGWQSFSGDIRVDIIYSGFVGADARSHENQFFNGFGEGKNYDLNPKYKPLDVGARARGAAANSSGSTLSLVAWTPDHVHAFLLFSAPTDAGVSHKVGTAYLYDPLVAAARRIEGTLASAQ